MENRSLTLESIGCIYSCYPDCFGTPRQGALVPASKARLELAPSLRSQGYFDGLGEFSHVWLLWHFHRNEAEFRGAKVYPPRLGGEKVGVFASRSPHRPNPIGLTLARLLEVREDELLLAEIDLIDGTPIFDIKPYISSADRPAASRDGWTERLMPVSAPPLHFSAAAEAALSELALPISREHFRALISESLRLDPRPSSGGKSARDHYYFRLYAFDIGFRWQEQGIEVFDIRLFSSDETKI